MDEWIKKRWCVYICIWYIYVRIYSTIYIYVATSAKISLFLWLSSIVLYIYVHTVYIYTHVYILYYTVYIFAIYIHIYILHIYVYILCICIYIHTYIYIQYNTTQPLKE